MGMRGIAGAIGGELGPDMSVREKQRVLEIASDAMAAAALDEGMVDILKSDPKTANAMMAEAAVAALEANGQGAVIEAMGGREAALRNFRAGAVGFQSGVTSEHGGPLSDYVAQFGDSTMRERDKASARAEVNSVIAQIVSGEGKVGLEGLAQQLLEAGMDQEGGTLPELVGSFLGVDFTGEGRERLEQLGEQLGTLQQDYAARREAIEVMGLGDEETTRRIQAVEKQFASRGAKLLEMIDGSQDKADPAVAQIREELTRQQEKAPATEADAAGGGGGGIRNVTLDGATINLNGTTIATNVRGSIPVSDGTADDSAAS